VSYVPPNNYDYKVPFDFTSGTMVLRSVVRNSNLFRAAVRITTPFDGLSTVSFGTSGFFILPASDISSGVPGQYETDEIVIFPLDDVLILAVAAVGATQGAGLLLYNY
jgi:hypothetical protein